MGHENPGISSGQKEREIGLTSCSDEWVVPKSPLLLSGKSEMITQLRQKNILFGIGGKWPITHRRQLWIFSHQCSAWFFYFLSSFSAGNLWRWKWRSNGWGDRERERQVFFFFFENQKNAGLERERETNGDKRLKPNVDRERESDVYFFFFLGFRDRFLKEINEGN